jgi:putative dimethyl sulfoxide reductase chaperone
MQIPDEIHEVASVARIRGLIYAVLGWAWRYPDDDMMSTVEALVEAVLDQYGEADDATLLEPAARTGLGNLSTVLRRSGFDSSQAMTDYALLFGHAVRGSCPLYELEYGQAEIVQQAGELADIAGFYTAFGLDHTTESMERVDHVSVECEFMSVLCAKEAQGILSNDPRLSEACGDAQRMFLRDHLARWLPALGENVTKSNPDGFYGSLARLSKAFLRSECQAFGITPGADYLELRKVDPGADSEIQCGPGGGSQLVPLTKGGLCLSGGA